MPRKVHLSDDDSQKENQAVNKSMSKAKVKVEKGAAAKEASATAKLNRVASRVDSDEEQDEINSDTEDVEPSRSKRSGTLASESDDEEGEKRGIAEDENEDEDENDENESPSGRKRARLNEEGDAMPVKNEKIKAPRRVTLPRDRDGYVPGSIVRVQLENFVTYDFVEFHPGPNLNMIFGPNGTGKSSIACAICIGLNGAPSLLGRANDLNAFVKHGHDKAYVELELKGKVGMPNLVIRRSITSKNRSSGFTLNGTTVTGREVNERIAELNVQVSNLCSFLPQDRVSEFAQMSPQQLLKETQRTAGDENLTMWHTALIETGKELKTAQLALQDEKKQLSQLEEKKKALEMDVQRYRERRAIEHQIELYDLILPYVAYRESKVIYDERKVERDAAVIEYRQMEAANKPMKQLQAELNAEHSELDKERRTLKDEIQSRFTKTVNSINSRIKKAAEKAEEALDKIKAIKRAEKDLIRNKARTKEEIAKLQDKVNNPPENEDINPILEELKLIKTQVGELKVKRVELDNQIKELVRQTSEQDSIIREKQNELREQDDHMRRKINSLSKWDKDCAEVVMWLLNNKENNEFAKRVDLPAYLGVTVRDRRYVDAVEACFSANQFKTFVTHNEEDYNTFNRLFIDTPEALNRKARVTVWYRPQNMNQLLNPPLQPKELHDLGFDGYAIDFVDCPDGLKWFLAKELNMHRTPIASDPRKVDDSRVQEALSRLGLDGRPSPATSYISGNTLASVSRSTYGQQKIMTVTRSFRPARNFVHSTLDPSVKEAIDQDIMQAKQTNELLNTQIGELKDQDQAFLKELEDLKPRHVNLSNRRAAVIKAQDAAQSNVGKLESLKKKLDGYEKQPSAEESRQKHKVVVERTVKERSKILTELVNLFQTTIKDHSKLAVISLRQTQLTASLQAIDALCNERTAEAKRVKQNYDNASERFEAAKKDSRRKVDATREKLASVDEELREEFGKLEAQDQEKDPEERWTYEKVAVSLETEQARLELNHVTDSGVVATYEARTREIENLRGAVDKKEKKCRKLEEKINRIRDLWYPALTELVEAVGQKFSAAFDRVNCAGEIRIAEHEDYEKWSIQIFVKFRNNEPLTLLTSQRQSGGERSLTTILYLMSLTEHARAPFSLVDEINQGMDQRYERAVHDQLVEVTCKADSGQYFLITPKLLPGLKYHKNMKILCVNNGEWLPESKLKGVGNMRKMIDSFVARKANAN